MNRRTTSLTASFAIVLAASGHPAVAAVVTRVVNQKITATPDGPNQMYDLDVNLDGTNDFTFRSLIGLPEEPTFASFADIAPPFATVNGVVIDAFTGDGFPTVSRLQFGDPVSPASQFSGNNDLGNLSSQFFPDAATGNFQNQTGYVGLQFQGPGGVFYGFAQVTVNDLMAPVDPLAVTILSVSYESITGLGVVVPEPTAWALVSAAAVVGGLQRRRRALLG